METTVRLNKELRFAVAFARFVMDHRCSEIALARCIHAARNAKRYEERAISEQSDSDTNASRAEAWREHCALHAEEMGFKATWPGLWPCLTKDGKDFILPS